MKRLIETSKNRLRKKPLLATPVVSGSTWDLPDGVYLGGVDNAAKGSKDYSCQVRMEKGIIVAEEYYR